MEFYTQLTYPKPLFQFSYQDPVLLLGSCFVENIGTRMTDLKFQTDVNPFGTLYNPASISHAIRRLIEPEPYREKDLFSANGLFHSFDHHSRFRHSLLKRAWIRLIPGWMLRPVSSAVAVG